MSESPDDLVRIGAAVKRSLRDDLERLADANHHSIAAEIRAALHSWTAGSLAKKDDAA